MLKINAVQPDAANQKIMEKKLQIISVISTNKKLIAHTASLIKDYTCMRIISKFMQYLFGNFSIKVITIIFLPTNMKGNSCECNFYLFFCNFAILYI